MEDKNGNFYTYNFQLSMNIESKTNIFDYVSELFQKISQDITNKST